MMPKDSKNGFYRQEQNIGRLIAPFCVYVFAARSPPRPVVVHAARAHTMAVYAARTARAPLR